MVERSDTTGREAFIQFFAFDPHRGRRTRFSKQFCEVRSYGLDVFKSALPSRVCTKNRDPSIDCPWRTRLHEYLGRTISGLGGFTQAVGGVADHVHLLVGLRASQCLADVMRELKKSSSAWIHESLGLAHFAWQEGYAAFTVSATARDAVRQYIFNQEQHHRTRSWREELIEMLDKAGVAYDAEYFE